MRCFSLHYVITVTRVDVPQAFRRLSLYDSCLISLSNMYSLEYLINAVGLEVLLVVQPDIRLRSIVLNRDLDAAYFLLRILMVQPQAVSLFLLVLHNVIEKLVLDV